MTEVFSARSVIYWWGFLSATLFLREWLRNLAKFLQTSDLFAPSHLPFSLVPGLNSLVDNIAEFIQGRIAFNPMQEVVASGPFRVQGWMLAAGFGLILLGMVAYLYFRALGSSSWWDDFIALFLVYVALRIEGHIVAIADLPIQSGFRAFVNNPATAFLTLLVLLVVLVFFGEGFRSKRAFWRMLLEGTIVAVFMFPQETASSVAFVVQALGNFGQGLNENTTFAIVWGVIGMFLALQRLTTQEFASGAKG